MVMVLDSYASHSKRKQPFCSLPSLSIIMILVWFDNTIWKYKLLPQLKPLVASPAIQQGAEGFRKVIAFKWVQFMHHNRYRRDPKWSMPCRSEFEYIFFPGAVAQITVVPSCLWCFVTCQLSGSWYHTKVDRQGKALKNDARNKINYSKTKRHKYGIPQWSNSGAGWCVHTYIFDCGIECFVFNVFSYFSHICSYASVYIVYIPTLETTFFRLKSPDQWEP